METIKRGRGRPSTKKQLSKEDLLKLALNAFAQQGFDGMKLSLLAKEAGFANSLWNYYFENKEDLWKQTMEFAFEQLLEKFKSVHRNFKDLEGVPLLKVQTRQLVYFAAEFPQYFEVFLREMRCKNERTQWLMNNLLFPLHEQVNATLIREQEKNKLKKISPANLALIFIGAANMFFLYDNFLQDKYSINPFEEDQIEKHADAVIEVVFNGIINS